MSGAARIQADVPADPAQPAGPRVVVEPQPGRPVAFIRENKPIETRVPVAGGLAIAATQRAPDKPTPNEDAVAVIPRGEHACVLVIADGFGGLPGGDQAADVAINSMIEAIGNADEKEASLREGILNGFEKANEQVIALGIGAAATLSAVEIDGRTCRSYHVGDSTMLLVGQRGKIKLATMAHSPVAYAVEAGVLDEGDAMHHEERHIVSNMIGSTDMRIDIGPSRTIDPRDTILLATDGLFDNLHQEEIINLIRKGDQCKGLAALIRLCDQRMTNPKDNEPSKPDDLTVVTFRAGKA